MLSRVMGVVFFIEAGLTRWLLVRLPLACDDRASNGKVQIAQRGIVHGWLSALLGISPGPPACRLQMGRFYFALISSRYEVEK